MDKLGNLIIVGESIGVGTYFDLTTVKISTAGNILWSQRYNGWGNNADGAYAVVTDDSGNVFVTGYTTGSSTFDDITTIKYGPDGTQQWVSTFFNSSGNGYDEGHTISIDKHGNVYVGGFVSNSGITSDGILIKYNSGGTEIWHKRIGGTYGGADEIRSIAVDSSGNIYAAGYVRNNTTEEDYIILKYDQTGALLWSKQYNGSSFGQDYANSLVLDRAGNAIITGRSDNSSPPNLDIVTIKYSPQGTVLWEKRFDSAGEIGEMVICDEANNVIIGGESFDSFSTYTDILTLKYNSAGELQWSRIYNDSLEFESTEDYFSHINIDVNGNIFISGSSEQRWVPFEPPDIVTLIYNPSGTLLWKAKYNSPANNWDIGVGVHTDDSSNLFVVGESIGAGSNQDFITLRYDLLLTGIYHNNNIIPKNLYLHQNYPNPFNPETKIKFEIPRQRFVSLKVYDIAGKEVASFVNNELQAGVYDYSFDGSGLSSGVYFYQLESNGYIETRKMILLK